MLYALVYRAEEKKTWIGFRLRPGTVYLVFELNKRKKTEICIYFSTIVTVELFCIDDGMARPSCVEGEGYGISVQSKGHRPNANFRYRGKNMFSL